VTKQAQVSANTNGAKLEMSSNLANAYKEIIALRMTNGATYTALSRLKDPNNALVHYVENYADFFTIFIQEESEAYKVKIKNKEKRLTAIKASDPSSPYYLMAQAEIILQWAVLKLKFGEKISAANDVLEAYDMLKENKKKFPHFIENDKSLSIIHAMAESLPSWVRKIVGIKGSITEANREISAVVINTKNAKSIFYEEAVAIQCYILFYANNQKEAAYQLLESHALNHRTNHLFTFLKATMAQRTGRNEKAIIILSERQNSTAYLPFHYLDFIYGKAKLYRLDKDANVYIEKFINNFKGRHYIKEAYQKLAWYQLAIANKPKSYETTIAKSKQYGYSLFDEDIQAEKEAKSGKIPSAILMQARLLYDGGYYEKAYKLLSANTLKYTTSNHDGEYFYRLARIEEALNHTSKAMEHYQTTIKNSDPSQYYACNSALQLGQIYESKNQKAKARAYFEKCLALNPSGYASSIHAKAKAGLNRLK
jgi:hypothetical protein